MENNQQSGEENTPTPRSENSHEGGDHRPMGCPPLLSGGGSRYAPPPHRGSIWKLIVIAVVMGLLVFVFLDFGDADGLSRPGLPSNGSVDYGLEEVVLRDGSEESKVLVIDIVGVISSDSWDDRGRSLVESVEQQMATAKADDNIRAIILKVDSPGGEVLPADEISRLITKFQKEEGIPVIASLAGVAASGGYYVAAPCRWIVANELTLTGSIGVIMQGYNYRSLMDKVGVKPLVFKSGRFKDMLSSEKLESEITTEEKSMVQDMIQETYERFKEVVRSGRDNSALLNKDEGKKLSPDWADYADGRIFSGKKAFEHGFVDELGNFDTALTRAKKIAQLKDPVLVKYEAVRSFSSLLRFLGKTPASNSVRLEIGLDVPKMKSGRPYFLWVP